MTNTWATAGTNSGVSGVTSAATLVSLHSGDPSTTGVNEISGGTYAKVAETINGAAMNFNVPGGITITHYGVWNGATFLYGGTLAASEAYGSAGTYALTLTLTATGS